MMTYNESVRLLNDVIKACWAYSLDTTLQSQKNYIELHEKVVSLILEGSKKNDD